MTRKGFYPKVATNEFGEKEEITTRWDADQHRNNTWILMVAKFDSPCDDSTFFMNSFIQDHIDCGGIKQGDTIIFHHDKRANKKSAYHPECAYSYQNLMFAEIIHKTAKDLIQHPQGITEEELMDRLDQHNHTPKGHYAPV